MLHLELFVAIVLELTQLQRLVRPFLVNFLVELVFLVVDFLHDVLFSLNSGLNFTIELILEPCQFFLSLAKLFIGFGDSVADFLLDCSFKSVKSLISILEFLAVVLSHEADLGFKFLSQHPQLVLKLGPEGFESIVHSLCLGFGEVTVGLDFPLNVLELGLELLL